MIQRFFSRKLSAGGVPLVVVDPPGQDKRDWNDLLRTDGVIRTRKIFREQLESYRKNCRDDHDDVSI